jgi:hypothetical protein
MSTSDDVATTPGSDRVVIFSNFSWDNRYELPFLNKALTSEHYDVTEYRTGRSGPGTATLPHFLAAGGAGVFIISTHGGWFTEDHGQWKDQGAPPFRKGARVVWALWIEQDGDQEQSDAALKRYSEFRGPERSPYIIAPEHLNGIWLTQSGIEHFFGSTGIEHHSLVFIGACWSSFGVRDFGAQAYFGYSNPVYDSEVYNDWGLLFGDMTGTRNKGQDLAAAAALAAGTCPAQSEDDQPRPLCFTNDLRVVSGHVRLNGVAMIGTIERDIVLSPAVEDFAGAATSPQTVGDEGPFEIRFDAWMDTTVSPSSFLSAGSAAVVNAHWTSHTALTFELAPPPADCAWPCQVTVMLDAKRATSYGTFGNWLAGNTNSADTTNGIAPNGDDYSSRLTIYDTLAAAGTPKGSYVAAWEATPPYAEAFTTPASITTAESLTVYWGGFAQYNGGVVTAAIYKWGDSGPVGDALYTSPSMTLDAGGDGTLLNPFSFDPGTLLSPSTQYGVVLQAGPAAPAATHWYSTLATEPTTSPLIPGGNAWCCASTGAWMSSAQNGYTEDIPIRIVLG